MKTTAIHITGALILTICLGVSCRKELPAQAEGGEPVTVTATISDAPDTRVTYSEDGNKLKSAWAVGDRIVGWTEGGAKLELEIANSDRIVNGTAVFTTVSGSAALPASGNIYMIYAPGKHFGDVGTKSLTVDLRNQSEGVIPALMMAKGTVAERQISLDFSNQMSIVMVKNPKFPQADPNTLIGGLALSGENVFTSVKFDGANGALTMTPSAPGSIIKPGAYTIGTGGTPTSDVTFYFAVPPTNLSKEITVSSFVPEGYAFYLQNRKFVKNKCYKIAEPEAGRFEYNITAMQYEGGTFITSPATRSPWGSEVTITPTPTDQHWLFDSGSLKVTIDGSSTALALLSNKFTMPQHDVTVAGTFQKRKYKLTLSVNDYSMGSATLKYTGGSTIDSGSEIEWGPNVTVTATPSTYYVLDKMTYTYGSTTKNPSLTGNTGTFDMPKGNTTVNVNFQKRSYNITKGQQTNGTFNVSHTTRMWDEIVTVEAFPDAGYILDEMTYLDGSTWKKFTLTSGTKGTFYMPKCNTTVNVTFKKIKYKITLSVNDGSMGNATLKYTTGGTITSGSEIEWGTGVTVTATPSTGYILDKMTYTYGSTTKNPSLTGNTGTFDMPKGNTTVNVTFKIHVPGTTPTYPEVTW